MPPAPGASLPPLPSVPALTGERTWPDIPSETYWFTRHVACYRWASSVLATDLAGREVSTDYVAPVLDAGSGEGYGASELSRATHRPVIGVELDASTALHASTRYPELSQTRANLVALPFRTSVFAAAVSFQVVEHIWDPLAYLRELARCTHGPVLISTPNRPVHSPGLPPGGRPDNPFHVREFDAQELSALLYASDPERTPTFFGLRHGPTITSWEEHHGSLPAALVSAVPSAVALTFAEGITADDFVIDFLDPHVRGPSVHDLAVHDLPVHDLSVHDLIALW